MPVSDGRKLPNSGKGTTLLGRRYYKRVAPLVFAVFSAVTGATLSLADQSHAADAPKLVVTIKPLHGLVAAVTKGVTEPVLLLDGPQSPHSFALKPSQAAQLNSADFIFFADETLELPIVRVGQSLPKTVSLVPLIEAPGLEILAMRQGAAFDAHDHGGHGHGGHGHDDHKDEAAHGHDKKDDHGHKGHDHGHDHSASTKHGADRDPHFWLDPQSARWVVAYVVDKLSERFPEHRDVFEKNAAAVDGDLVRLEKALGEVLSDVKARPFLVFHDAFQYFENRFGLQGVGAISVNPEVLPGAKRLSELRARVAKSGVVCVFAEPQFQSRVIDTVIEGSPARKAVIDPLGANVPPGPEHYSGLMTQIADVFKQCLGKSS